MQLTWEDGEQGATNMIASEETIDLADIAAELAAIFAGGPPLGYVPGRTVMRDAVVSKLDCSQLQAEEIVDTMIARGFLIYEGSATDAVDLVLPWRIIPRPTFDN